ncbi:MAG: type II secretion system protein N [Gammaproteobacteria bacterium]|nr:type II secretion system protein N [Gammaproteobacteria bacterium]
MKKKYYYLTAIISYLSLLIATIPASTVIALLDKNSPVTMQGITGTLWHGKAYSIMIDDTVKLTDTEWSVTAWKIISGRLAMQIDTHYQKNNISGEIGASFLGRIFINELTAKISAADVSKLAAIPLAQLDGLISLDITHAEWKQGELPLASGRIIWENATVTVADTTSLGNVTITLGESEQQQLSADIQNQGGDIKISGSAELMAEADYAVDIKLLPTASANSNIKQSLGLFAQRTNNGEYILKKSGSLEQIM